MEPRDSLSQKAGGHRAFLSGSWEAEHVKKGIWWNKH